MLYVLVASAFAGLFIIQDMVECTKLHTRAQARHKARNTRVTTHDGLLEQAEAFVKQAAVRTAARKAADRLIARGEELVAKANPVPTPMWEVEEQQVSRLEAEVRTAAESAAQRLIARGEELVAKSDSLPTPMWEVEERDLPRLDAEVQAYVYDLACSQAADRVALRRMGVASMHPLAVRGEELSAAARAAACLAEGADIWARLLDGELVTVHPTLANSALEALEHHGFVGQVRWAGDGLVDVVVLN